MNKNQEIEVGTKLRYKDQHAENQQTHLIFLGYDSNCFHGIWVDDLGEHKYMSIDDVELV